MSTGGQRKLGERSRMGLEINALKEIEELKIDAGGTAAGGGTPSGGDSTAISLIELAEILDQHKIWAERIFSIPCCPNRFPRWTVRKPSAMPQKWRAGFIF